MLVSAIMPTRNRRHLIGLALRSFFAQDWQHKELIVLDDGEDAVRDLLPDSPRISYFRIDPHLRMTIGAKRNLACELARGQVIIHWDDDDWSAPGRITDQVLRLMQCNREVSGYHSLLFYDQKHSRAFKYLGDSQYSCGTALCYRREYSLLNRFPDANLAEDNAMVYRAAAAGQIISADAGQMMVARIHADNTSSHKVGIPSWPEVSTYQLPPEFLDSLQL